MDAAAGLWERKRGLDPHRLDRGGEDRLLCDGSEQPAPGGRLILHGAPESVVRRHEAHVTSCKWHHNPLRIFHLPVMCNMLSMSTLHQVSHFEDEDQILSHLAAKSASAYVLHLLHQSVRAPATHAVSCETTYTLAFFHVNLVLSNVLHANI